MKKMLLFFVLSASISCKNEQSSSDKDNIIQSQEEKIKALEDRLNKIENEKNSYSPATTTMPQANQPASSTETEKKKRYITLGMTEKEVLDIQGTPSSIHDLYQSKIYRYGISEVTFRNGKLVEYSNLGGNLKLDMGGNDN